MLTLRDADVCGRLRVRLSLTATQRESIGHVFYTCLSLSWYRNADLLEMTIRTITVPGLKSLKNSVIGNPSAKAALAQDETFVRLSVLHLSNLATVLIFQL